MYVAQTAQSSAVEYSASEPPAPSSSVSRLTEIPQNPTRPASRCPQKEESRESGRSWSSASLPPPPSAPPPRPYPSHRPGEARLLPPPSRSTAESQLEVRPGQPSLLFFTRRLACSDAFASGWCCASAAVPDPAPSEELASASYTVVVADKPDSPADDKVDEVSAAPSGSAEAPMAELVPSEASPSPDDGGLDEILSKVSPPCCGHFTCFAVQGPRS